MSTVLTAPTLAERRADLTERLILDAAVEMLEEATVGELTARAVARQAAISERTVFRYFATRELLLDAVAGAVRAALAVPTLPTSIKELLAYPAKLYARFEEKERLTRAALHTELFDRMRETQAKDRWIAVQRIIASQAPRTSTRDQRIAAANIRYYLAATTWHYYRFYFGFTLAESVACAETAIRQSLTGLRKRK